MTHRLAEIDVLRGLAAVTVVLSHYLPYWNRYVGDLPPLVPNELGYHAVKIFFVVSGFVIPLTLARCRTVRDFAVLRFSRLYPVYWASLLLVTSVGAYFADREVWRGGLLVNMTMFQEFVGVAHFDIVYWSLTVELAFYMNIAWLFALRMHDRVTAIVLVWLIASLVWVVATQEIGAVTAVKDASDEPRSWLALLFALDYSPYFAIGLLFYRATLCGWNTASKALLALALGVEFLLASWEGLAVALAGVALFWLAIRGHLAVVTGRLTVGLGAISYSLYLVHRNLGYDALAWLGRHGVHASVAITATVGGALLIAAILTFGVERPASRWIRDRYRRFVESGGVRRVA